METVNRLNVSLVCQQGSEERLDALSRDKKDQMRKIEELSKDNQRLKGTILDYQKAAAKHANDLYSERRRIKELGKEKARLKKQLRDNDRETRLAAQTLDQSAARNDELRRKNDALTKLVKDTEVSNKQLLEKLDLIINFLTIVETLKT